MKLAALVAEADARAGLARSAPIQPDNDAGRKRGNPPLAEAVFRSSWD